MLPVVCCAAAVAALLLAEHRGSRRGVWLAKPVASACFLWAALAWGALDDGYGRLVLLGLVLCAAGDVLLIPREKPASFQAGIASFLLGHVAYAVAFVGLGLAAVAALGAALVMALVAWRVLGWLLPHAPGDFQLPVKLYVAVISAMVVCAVGSAGAGASALVPAGAIGFALSDLAVARDRFVAPGFVNGAWGLPLYYAAQLLLAASV